MHVFVQSLHGSQRKLNAPMSVDDSHKFRHLFQAQEIARRHATGESEVSIAMDLKITLADVDKVLSLTKRQLDDMLLPLRQTTFSRYRRGREMVS